MADDDPAEELEDGAAYAVDTVADKAVRFGCGAALASLIFVGSVVFGLAGAWPFGMAGVVTLGILFIAAIGLFSVTHGERFLRGLLNVVNWLV
jgi:hypothetical protein